MTHDNLMAATKTKAQTLPELKTPSKLVAN